MIKNYFKTAFRNLWRNKGFSAINITGLAIGIATCLIIMMYVNNELGYDRFNTKAGRIYRVYFEGNVQQEKLKEATVMAPVAQTFKNDFPEVEDATRIRTYGKPRLVYADKTFNDDEFAYVDANFFQVFTLPLIEGNAATALKAPNSVVITRAIAKKYFGDTDPMGKVLHFKDEKNSPCKVTGVIDKVPANAHFHFELFASMAGVKESFQPNWMSSNFYTYLLLRKGFDYRKLESKLPGEVDKYIGPQMLEAMHITLSDFRKKGNDISFHLQPLTDIHLYADFRNDLSTPGNLQYVYIFGAIALFMLLIACINFMNLSTAGASKRFKEVGIRKVLGSGKTQLVKQFLVESVFVAAIALIIALVLIYFALPVFNQLAGQSLSIDLAAHPLLIPGLLLFVLFTGILAGSYPAFYLSSFQPVAVLKGKFISGKNNVSLRSGLVVFQFLVSIFLIIGTMVVFNQLSFIRNKDLGFEKDNILVIQNTWMLGKNQKIFRQQLAADPRVESVSASRYLPAALTENNNYFITRGNESAEMIKTLRFEADENYIPTLGIQIKQGRNFSPDFGTDSNAIIINEATAAALGWGDGLIGKTVNRANKDELEQFHIIGVVKNFHFRSLHEKISPLIIALAPDPGTLIVKLKNKNAAGLVATLSQRWSGFGAEEAMSYSFLDERYAKTYQAEQKAGLILAIFAGLTIFVACLGLFGLATFTAHQRTKEIGVRKVLGASTTQIYAMLSKEFLKLILIACVIAFPLAWWAMNSWLQDFAYRINIHWWFFFIALAIAMLIAFFTISFQAMKAALANPVKNLRTE